MSAERMAINLCRPSFPIRRASVIPVHKIVCLTKLYPDETVGFIWGGELLVQTMTFVFYGIGPLASIVVLGDDLLSRPTVLDRWLEASRNSEDFDDRIRFLATPGARAEAARLRDLRDLLTPRRGIRALGGNKEFDFNDPGAWFAPAAGLYNGGFGGVDGPSCEPLPNPWNVKRVAETRTGGVSELIKEGRSYWQGATA
jgi:hypothetical protein